MFPVQFPSFVTERLALRQIQPEDQIHIFNGLSHPHVIQYYGVSFDTYEATQEQMEWYKQLWQEQTGIWWGIYDREDQCFLGACGYNEYQATHHKIELGYWLLPEYWGKGYVQEALRKIIPYAFQQLQIERIEAFVETGNDASDKVLLKQGFQYEGTMRNCESKNGSFISLKIFALLRGESMP
ncbi:MAG: GNAT family N-acetyltransferase [Saprospiraceae bacterium]|nr:GNAT family N-acetyltransferase [Saprospiraceae bacterium]